MERILKTDERKNFELVASILTYMSPNGKHYELDNTYLDYGANWRWTTIIRYSSDYSESECQVLSPRQWKDIETCETFDDIMKCVNDIRTDKYFGDK